ncbi:MAG: glycoside hydrolase family 2 protein [Promethearchaeota archaeon]
MNTISLDGIWKYYIDNKEEGEEKRFWKKTYKKINWKTVNIPCNWYIGLNLDYNGIIWFFKKFSIDSAWKNSLIRIFFKGIDYYAKIWINGNYIGFHEGYFGHFSYNISRFLNYEKPDDNELVIQVNAPLDKGYPMKKRQFKGGFIHWDCRPGNISKRGQEKGSGGIWDSVYLKISNDLHFKYVKIISNDINKEESKVKIKIVGFNANKNGLDEVKLIVNVSPKNFEGSEQSFTFNINRINHGRFIIDQKIIITNPKLWWSWDLGKPNLYSITLTLKFNDELLDEWKDTFGIRLAEYKADGWHLNSKKLFLRGANFFSNLWLCQMDDDSYKKSINLVREANLNFLRISYHVEKSNFYNLIDEAGIILQQDFPTLWDYEYSVEAVNAGIKQCKEMATQLHNHPSIFVYSCFTEPFSKGSHLMAKIFRKAVEKTDISNRLVWSESSFFGHPFCGWYYLTKYSYLIVPGAPYPSEFGPQSLPNLNSPTWNPENLNLKANWPPNDNWEYHNSQTLLLYHITNATPNLGLKGMIKKSQNYQGNNLKFAIETFRRNKGKIHTFALFMFKDAWPSITWSIVDYFNLPKKSFYEVKKACSPVLCSFSLSELKKFPYPKIKLGIIDLGLFLFGEIRGLLWNENISPGQKKPIYLYVINDLINEIDGKIILKGEYNEKFFFERTIEMKILPSSNKLCVKLNLKVSKAIKKGKIKIIAELFDGKNNCLLHDNKIEIKIMKKFEKILYTIKRYLRSLKNNIINGIQGIHQWLFQNK